MGITSDKLEEHLPSTSMRLGTKGTELVALIISFAVIILSFPNFTFCGP